MYRLITICFLLALLGAGCKKEKAVAAYPVGKGRITGTTSNGISFTTEGSGTYFYVTRSSFSGWGVKDDLIVQASVDLSVGRSFTIWMGAYDNKAGMYYLNANAGNDLDNVSFTQEQNPVQAQFNLFNPTAGLRPFVNITRLEGNNIAGTYFARLQNNNSSPQEITIEGSFEGNLEIRQ